MRLSKVVIKNFRCHKYLELEFNEYMIFLGPNGSGKSSVLYALDWFFNGQEDLTTEDIHKPSSEELSTNSNESDQNKTIEVTVEFSDLNKYDRHVLGMYGRKDTACFRRSWAHDSGEKIVGNALQGPGFASIRKHTKATPAKNEYNAVRKNITDLPPWQNHSKAKQALDAWEAEPTNIDKLEPIDDSDASHLFGFTGTHVLAKCFRMILVPAAADLSIEVGTAGKGSVLAQVLNTAVQDITKQAQQEWQEENENEIRKLEESIRKKLRRATQEDENRINSYLTELVPDAKVILKGIPQPWTMRTDASIQADVMVDNQQISLNRQGHGVQRAVLIAALQSMVPNKDINTTTSESTTATGTSVESPAVILALEEPEVYQHPVRARHFGRILQNIASTDNVQVAIATHSPYFVPPDQFPNIRRFFKRYDTIKVYSATIPDIAQSISSNNYKKDNIKRDGKNQTRVNSFLQRKIPNQFSESFFSDGVVLVEGDTDRVILEAAATILNKPLDQWGISVIEVGGKPGLEIPFRVLQALGIPVFVMFDADCKLPYNDQQDVLDDTTKQILEWLPKSHALVGSNDFASRCVTTVTPNWTIFKHDLENELEEWPSFCKRIEELGGAISQKKVDDYWNAALSSDSDDMPANLRSTIDAIFEFGSRASYEIMAEIN